MHFLTTCFFLPMVYTTVVVQIHRSAVYNPTAPCAFLRNASWSTAVKIESCIWECVHENKCQTAVYFSGERVCSMFAEACKVENIHSSGAIQANVICYGNDAESVITCPSTALPQPEETTTALVVATIIPITTNVACRSTCVNTITSTAALLAFYTFDSTTADATGAYPPTGITSPNYVVGWVGNGVRFNAADAQYFTVGNIPLNSSSFTIEFWFYATNITAWDYAFMGEYSASQANLCLFINIRNQKLIIGFFNDDLKGITTLVVNRWYHAAFTFDSGSRQMTIYLNGVLDSQGILKNSFLGSSVPFTIGGATIGGSTSLNVYYSGIIDHVTVSSRVKSECEVYLDANLACYFTFDSSSSVLDSGPNFLTATNTGAVAVPGGLNGALQFTSTMSYITINGISALQSTASAFSISMWVYPTSTIGGATLIHASTQPNGQGACMVMWGLTSSGVVSVNVIDATDNTIAATASVSLAINAWTHITQTFSKAYGNRLYINGALVSTAISTTGHPLGPYTVIGASPAGTGYCGAGSISPGQFFGAVEEYRVFGIELTSEDVCRLANH